ncbi:MAG TPA: 4a-hydroxytetrahydrobiopterin dehydratase [Kofleriaceae bacterium]|jgi:4a-hydroxytetrahydrobiopterin dehydratase|nr:4a-hydroxytetrahydrobiopterin dehydratase [Kofleriaceae bacterium]
MDELALRHCTPYPPGPRRLSAAEAAALLAELGHGWTVDGERLRRSYELADFAAALGFVNELGAIAERENHHPDVLLGWGKVAIELWTHDVGGLSENDFIVAAKIERAFAARGAAVG